MFNQLKHFLFRQVSGNPKGFPAIKGNHKNRLRPTGGVLDLPPGAGLAGPPTIAPAPDRTAHLRPPVMPGHRHLV